jgi:hypothetical protein
MIRAQRADPLVSLAAFRPVARFARFARLVRSVAHARTCGPRRGSTSRWISAASWRRCAGSPDLARPASFVRLVCSASALRSVDRSASGHHPVAAKTTRDRDW